MENLNLSVCETSLIVFATQILFLYLRTLNVRATAHDKLWMAVLTGVGIGLAWMIGTTIGVSAMLKGE